MMSENTIQLLDPAYFSAVRDTLRNCVAPTPEALSAAREVQRKNLRQVKGRVAVVPVHGYIEQHMSGLGYYLGGTSTDLLSAWMDALTTNGDVETIVLDFDTPGGISYGVEEMADQIFAARSAKQIIGVANSMAASAGYWLLAACDQCYVTPGGDVGSVGVYSMHVDYSGALEQEGVKVEFTKAGKFKTEGNPYEPLTDEARSHIQEAVDDTYTAFVKAVARNRGRSTSEVRNGFGEGRTLTAARAVSAGMVDKVMSLREVLGKLMGNNSSADQASTQVLRMRQQLRKWRTTRAAG